MSDSAEVSSELPAMESQASLTPDLLSFLHVVQLDFHTWGSQAVQMG